MNNKIKALELLCYEDRSHGYSVPYFNREKFAKLIIEECAKIARYCYQHHIPLSEVPNHILEFKEL